MSTTTERIILQQQQLELEKNPAGVCVQCEEVCSGTETHGPGGTPSGRFVSDCCEKEIVNANPNWQPPESVCLYD